MQLTLQQRIEQTRQGLQAQRSKNPALLLTVCIDFILASSEQKLTAEYKYMLFTWALNEPCWNAAEVTRFCAGLPETGRILTIDEAKKYLELAYQIERFIDFGEYYWGKEWHWDSQPRMCGNSNIINLILRREQFRRTLQHG